MDDLPVNMRKCRHRGKPFWHRETACPHAHGTGRAPQLPLGRLYSGRDNWDSLIANRGRNSMKLLRRDFLTLGASALAASALPRLAFALDYPTRPTRIIAGFAAGGGV